MINRGDNIIAHNKIVCVAEHPEFESRVDEMIIPLRDKPHREVLGQHSYHCLPVVIGNQYGFVLRSMVSWTAIWNGGPHPEDTKIIISEGEGENGVQVVSSHFGQGIVTVQNRFNFRTAPGVNLMVLDPPNYFLENLSNLFAVVETDNLRRDFTFNLKIVKPKTRVKVRKGDIISAIIPIPRYYVDDFSIELGSEQFDEQTLEVENQQVQKFADQRYEMDIDKPLKVGKLYWRGLDADEEPFPDHQRKLRPAGWSDQQENKAEKQKGNFLSRLFSSRR